MTTYDQDRHHRRSVRWRGYDYRQVGAYFLTLCSVERALLFGDIVDGQMCLNEIGQLVATLWRQSPLIRPTLAMDAFVVMPNHLHGIVFITDAPTVTSDRASAAATTVGAHSRAPHPRTPVTRPTCQTVHRPARSIGSFVAGFKAATSREVNRLRNAPGTPIWQRNYYDRVIRDEAELQRIRQYIIDNPRRWAEDEDHPDRLRIVQRS